jgi:hypothetical protein
MSVPLIQCPACKGTLLEGIFNHAELLPCPLCRTPVKVEVFPALFRPTRAGGTGEAILVEGESNCFFHAGREAVIPCQSCGRFLCSLCDCEVRGEHYCPSCLDSLQTKGKIKSLDNQRVRYDKIALALAVYPVVLVFTIYFTAITAPLSLFIAIKYWNAPFGIVQGSRIRLVVAIILALLQIGGWILLIAFLVTR